MIIIREEKIFTVQCSINPEVMVACYFVFIFLCDFQIRNFRLNTVAWGFQVQLHEHIFLVIIIISSSEAIFQP